MLFLILTVLGLFLSICIFNILYLKYGRQVISSLCKLHNTKGDKKGRKELTKEFIKGVIARSSVAFVSMVIAIMCIWLSEDILSNKVSLIILGVTMLALNVCAFISLKEFWEVIKIADKFIEKTSTGLYRRRRFYGNGATSKY